MLHMIDNNYNLSNETIFKGQDGRHYNRNWNFFLQSSNGYSILLLLLLNVAHTDITSHLSETECVLLAFYCQWIAYHIAHIDKASPLSEFEYVILDRHFEWILCHIAHIHLASPLSEFEHVV